MNRTPFLSFLVASGKRFLRVDLPLGINFERLHVFNSLEHMRGIRLRIVNFYVIIEDISITRPSNEFPGLWLQDRFEQLRIAEMVAAEQLEAAHKRAIEEKEWRKEQEEKRLMEEKRLRERVCFLTILLPSFSSYVPFHRACLDPSGIGNLSKLSVFKTILKVPS